MRVMRAVGMGQAAVATSQVTSGNKTNVGFPFRLVNDSARTFDKALYPRRLEPDALRPDHAMPGVLIA